MSKVPRRNFIREEIENGKYDIILLRYLKPHLTKSHIYVINYPNEIVSRHMILCGNTLNHRRKCLLSSFEACRPSAELNLKNAVDFLLESEESEFNKRFSEFSRNNN